MHEDARETLGSLFTGCGGLDLGLERGARLRTAWQAQHDPDSRKQPCNQILERHWNVPNHGDIQRIDWADVEPVTVLAGGFPCQDISNAGLGAGIAVGTRSGLWFEFLRAIRALRPRVVVVENVSALVARGLGIVQRDLAEAGYDTRWACFRASDLGAPHGRERLFLVATDSEREPVRIGRGDDPRAPGAGEGEGQERQRLRTDDGWRDRAAPDADGSGHEGRQHAGGLTAGQGQALADADAQRSDGTGRARPGRRQPPGIRGEAPTHAYGWGWEGEREPQPGGLEGSRWGVVDGRDAVREQHDCSAPTDAQSGSWGFSYGDGPLTPNPADWRYAAEIREGAEIIARWRAKQSARTRRDIQWGAYEPAIRRWESLTRPAPNPTDDRGRLEPEFVGWLLGFPPLWTDGVSRTAQLKMLGNAVQIQAAEFVGLAVRSLLNA